MGGGTCDIQVFSRMCTYSFTQTLLHYVYKQGILVHYTSFVGGFVSSFVGEFVCDFICNIVVDMMFVIVMLYIWKCVFKF